jgi:hypothetical protein
MRTDGRPGVRGSGADRRENGSMDTQRNTSLRIIIWACPYGRKGAASVAAQVAQCRRAAAGGVIVDELCSENRRRPYRELLAHCRARDFDVLIVRDWHVLARTPEGFRFWVCEVLGAGARLYDAHSRMWIDGVEGRRFKTSAGRPAQMVRLA